MPQRDVLADDTVPATESKQSVTATTRPRFALTSRLVESRDVAFHLGPFNLTIPIRQWHASVI
jgi:hypothetical protein